MWRRTLPKAGRLQRQAIAEARLQDALTAQFARELDRTLRLLTRRTRRIVLQLEQADGRRLIASQSNLGRALLLRNEIIAALEASGYPALAQAAADEPLDRIAAQVLRGRSIANQAARLTAGQLGVLVALKDLRLAELLELGDDAVTALQRAVLDGVAGARSVPDLVDDLEDLLSVTNRQARTIYDTSISTFGRHVNQIGTSGEPDELFFYAGPADSLLRPFCRERVGRVYRRAQIGEMTNGQLPNVMLTGGGYNCRHTWSPVSELDDELRRLADMGERLPVIASDLEAVAA